LRNFHRYPIQSVVSFLNLLLSLYVSYIKTLLKKLMKLPAEEEVAAVAVEAELDEAAVLDLVHQVENQARILVSIQDLVQ
jgi:hypothetical protein